MKRRRFVALALAGALPRAVHAQQPKKLARIGLISPGTPVSAGANVQAFRDGLRDLGRIEGKGIAIEYRFADGRQELFPVLAGELVRLNPDCIIAGGFGAVQALMRLTRTIPIVIGNIDADPVREGIVASLARPGGNITGLTGIGWELAGKRLELLREIVPTAQRIAILFDPHGRAGFTHVEGTQAAAKKLGIELQLLEARQPDDVNRAFKTMRARRAEALAVIHVGLISSLRSQVATLAMNARLPAIYSDNRFVADGGLIGYAPEVPDQYRRAAVFVDKILNGTKPADLPVEQPTKFELAINMKTAKALGITFPPTILVRAERVIE